MPTGRIEELEEMQQGLRLVMEAVKRADVREAERLLFVLGH